MVFFDFDATITTFDVLDEIIKHFSANDDWKKHEKDWAKGKIGSRECLEKQIQSVRVTERDLARYLSLIRIDPHFHGLFTLLKREGVRPVILSDNFHPIIEAILRNNGVNGIKIYANALKFQKNRLIPSFPRMNKKCSRCGHCKKKTLQMKNVRDKVIIYVGDGLSDICPAECSDLVFAKGRLLNYFRDKKKLCVSFTDLEDVYNYFGRLENGQTA